MKQVNEKLRVVTRRDLSLPTQAVQSAHAAIDFQHAHPIEATEWQSKSNYLALLTVANEEDLVRLSEKADSRGIKYTIFREPDINNEITAIAFEPSDSSRRLTSSFPLLGREINNNV